MGLSALVFDCDGVLVDTERDGHRVAFNRAFAGFGLDIAWSEALYGELLEVAGGKERMAHYFERFGWPPGVDNKDELIKSLHLKKTEQFKSILDGGDLNLRPGVMRLVDEAIAAGVKLGVCSTSNSQSVMKCVELLGSERVKKFDTILCGDVVVNKKPDPEIYKMAQKNMRLSGDECMVIEDSRIGMLAAVNAGMNCVVTTSSYTGDERFTEADRVVPELGDGENIKIGLDDLAEIVANKK